MELYMLLPYKTAGQKVDLEYFWTKISGFYTSYRPSEGSRWVFTAVLLAAEPARKTKLLVCAENSAKSAKFSARAENLLGKLDIFSRVATMVGQP